MSDFLFLQGFRHLDSVACESFLHIFVEFSDGCDPNFLHEQMVVGKGLEHFLLLDDVGELGIFPWYSEQHSVVVFHEVEQPDVVG